MHTQADGSRLLELRNSLGRQTARPREPRPSTYPRGRSRRPSPRRLCARSVLHSSDGGDGFHDMVDALGEILVISRPSTPGTPTARGLRLQRSSPFSDHQDQASSREPPPITKDTSVAFWNH
ncbi:hypothetical protein CMEL01_05232 [Colletotrichum melonis]|uniref:Uncharacterized protein n=1 Tax=Colletotrichum melonis TaxID=1209925 RepID=A0AAI9U872_9PEZI|nr:hypothetical protein CMEL01_05232 [Colletotrichum melonis]